MPQGDRKTRPKEDKDDHRDYSAHGRPILVAPPHERHIRPTLLEFTVPFQEAEVLAPRVPAKRLTPTRQDPSSPSQTDPKSGNASFGLDLKKGPRRIIPIVLLVGGR